MSVEEDNSLSEYISNDEGEKVEVEGKVSSKNKRKEKNKKKKNKRVELELMDEDYVILETDFDKLKDLVISNIKSKIEEIENKIDEINSDNNIENKKAAKKNYIAKLKKFKKDLLDENIIKRRTKLLGIRKRKLSKIAGKVEVKIEKVKKQNMRCFNCRKKGHTVAECTKKEKENTTLCYNCGATDHNIYGCSKKVDLKSLPFAECFICKEKGHISANCPTSEKGIYVRGGSCFICKGVDHLAKNCPQKQAMLEEEQKAREARLLKKKKRMEEEALQKEQKEKEEKLLKKKKKRTNK